MQFMKTQEIPSHLPLLHQLKRDEGLRLTRYIDTLGHATIGYGHATGAIPETCTEAQADAWLIDDALHACKLLHEHLPWTDKLDSERLAVLQNMTFNIGLNGLLKFHRMLTFVEDGKFERAAVEMLHSAWYTQVKERATRLAIQMSTGLWQ